MDIQTQPPFDPYHIWLAIPPADQPPNYYQLLGLQLYESNVDVIRNAADQKTIYVRRVGTNEYEKFGQDLLNQIQEAKLCLSRPDRKEVYDQSLRSKLEVASDSRVAEELVSRRNLEPSWRIGCDPTCDIECNSSTVSGFHCVVTRLASKTIIEDLGSKNGTFVNARKVVGKTEIHAFDLLVLGRETRIRLPKTVFNESSSRIAFGIIGRNSQCEIHVQNETISYFHARCWLEKEDLFLEDLKSTNGTRLLDSFGRTTRLAPFEPAMLDLGQSIQLGKHLLTTDFLRSQLS